MTDEPSITVVVATRDRGANVVTAVETVLRNQYPRFDVVVVDQSVDDTTRKAVQHGLNDARVRYVRSATAGLSVARNIGIGQAVGELIAMTDDDCRVDSNWLVELAAAFALDPRIGIVFGNVVAEPHDGRRGFVPCYVRSAPYTARGMHQKHQVEGISACMGLRREVWRELGGFDECLGAGAAFGAGEETDLVIKALSGGYWVHETPRVTVEHCGFRSWQQGRRLIHDYLYGTGAVFAKHLRCGNRKLPGHMMRLGWRFMTGKAGLNLGNRQHRCRKLLSFARGFFAAAALAEIDPASGFFVPRRKVRHQSDAWRTS